ncbi:MAG: ATP-binding cassette domain-containing protein [Chitinivibrionales bacterium]|nr:ATP-binding cassette domain-containing protein [Chitinivibrionales bacterium]
MIRFDGVWKEFKGGTVAVRDLSLEVVEGETLVLLGTSGSGKTTTMKMANRLIEPTRGTITIGGKDIMAQNPVELRRSIGYAIQHIGLFPHMTVGENIAVVPSLLGWSSSRVAARIEELLQLVGLDPRLYRDRYPWQLSGGQKQRIGVARSLAADPPIVLMDEPFGALDPITREQLQNEFMELESTIRKTIIFVTHDVFEAVKMGDRVAVLDGGELQQVAPPLELVEKPANEFVDAFLGRHRFQLSLATATLSAILEKRTADTAAPAQRPAVHATPRTSLGEALDMLKRNRLESLPVYRDDAFVDRLGVRDILGAVGDTLAAAEKEGSA